MADTVDKFSVRFWNGSFYATVKFPDGSSQELKSDTDLTYAAWQTKIGAAWDAIVNPPPEPKPVTLDEATVEQVAAEIKEKGWTAKDLGLDAGLAGAAE
jgi:hypothetical protein